jgi:hypothetical protein
MSATPDQERRARRIVGDVLGLHALTTSPNDPAAKFGYECALLAVVRGDEEKSK